MTESENVSARKQTWLLDSNSKSYKCCWPLKLSFIVEVLTETGDLTRNFLNHLGVFEV